MATDVKDFILVPQSYLPMQCTQSIQFIAIPFFLNIEHSQKRILILIIRQSVSKFGKHK